MSKKVVTVDQLLENATQSAALTMRVAEAAAAAIEGKQDKLTGTAGQVVGFNADGDAVAQDVTGSGQIEIVRIDVSSQVQNGITLIEDNEEGKLVGAMRFAKCSITGISNVIEPSTGHRLNFGTLHFMANIRMAEQQYYAPEEGNIKFNVHINPKNGKNFILNESFSEMAFRMLTFQGIVGISGGESLTLEGVYCDVALSKPTDTTDSTFIVSVNPAEILKPKNTFWIEFQTPIAWEYA